jgi:hypothetical protein
MLGEVPALVNKKIPCSCWFIHAATQCTRSIGRIIYPLQVGFVNKNFLNAIKARKSPCDALLVSGLLAGGES